MLSAGPKGPHGLISIKNGKFKFEGRPEPGIKVL
jgi:hypothetical protein